MAILLAAITVLVGVAWYRDRTRGYRSLRRFQHTDDARLPTESSSFSESGWGSPDDRDDDVLAYSSETDDSSPMDRNHDSASGSFSTSDVDGVAGDQD